VGCASRFDRLQNTIEALPSTAVNGTSAKYA
jgi:hypothetical protein